MPIKFRCEYSLRYGNLFNLWFFIHAGKKWVTLYRYKKHCFVYIVKILFTWAISYIGEEVRTPDKSRGFNSHRIIREELKSGEEYAITINGYRDGGFESSLQIHNLQPHHFTKYYCEAQNSKGDDGLVIHLLKGSQQQKRRAHVLNAGNSSNNLDKYSSLSLLAQLIITLVCTN